MAWCLMAPSHYLKQCWFIINEVLYHSPESNFIRNTQDINNQNVFENHHLKLQPHIPGTTVTSQVNNINSNHWQHDSINSLLGLITKKTLISPLLAFCEINHQWFPWQRASNAENVSIVWHQHGASVRLLTLQLSSVFLFLTFIYQNLLFNFVTIHHVIFIIRTSRAHLTSAFTIMI